MAKSKLDFPRTVYRKSENGKFSFTNKFHRDIKYDSMIVNNKEEYDIAVSDSPNMGYIDDFEGALFPEETEDEELLEEEKEEKEGF